MKKSIIISSIVLLLAFFMSVGASAANMTMKAELDSAHLLMGKQTTLHIVVSGEFSESGKIFTVDSLWNDI